MWTIVSHLCMVVLVTAQYFSALSEGNIKLCTDNPTGFENGTAIPAMLGKPVSVMFCVQCQSCLYISPYIQINHPNHLTGHLYYYYANNKDAWRPIIVNINSSTNKATINITIKAVQKEDFTDQFSVEIHTNIATFDNTAFVFHLREVPTSDPLKVKITANNNRRAEIRSGEIVEFRCSVDGCSDRITITRNDHPIAETTNCTLPIVHEITGVNCSHMGAYVCLAKSTSDQDVQDIAYLEVKGCYIKLCTDSPTSFQNGTAIPAMLGKPVSAVFCVQCQPCLYISPYIQIKHPNHPTVPRYYYYTNNKDAWRPIIVTITSSTNKATINITIKSVEKEDYTDQFSVDIHTNNGPYDNMVFVFHLSEVATSGPLKVKFTANNNRRAEIRSGEIVEFRCSVDGCPERVTITRNEHCIAETTNYTIPLVHEIPGVNCSHMGAYTCLAKSPSGQDVQEIANLEVKGCTSNSKFEQKSQGHEFESNTLIIALPPICFIIIVTITSGIVWYRVKGTASSRAEETDASSSGNKDGRREDHYENSSPDMSSNAEYEESAELQYESIILNTGDMEDLSQAEYVEIDDVQYETPVTFLDRK